jgi:hypothetical protein
VADTVKLDSIVDRQRARWDSVQKLVIPQVDRLCRTKSAPGYVCGADGASNLLKSLTNSGLADTLRTVTPDSGVTAPAYTVAIHSNGTGVAAGDSLQLYSEVKDSSGAVVSIPVSWSVDSAKYGTISATGVLKGVSAGSVTVYANTSNGDGSRVYSVTGLTVPPDTTTVPDTTAPDTMVVPPPPPPVGSKFYPVPAGLGGGVATIAQLPRSQVDVTYPDVSNGVRVPSGANLQTYLNAAKPGDVLLLPPGSTYSGGFQLPKHAGALEATCTGWVVIRTDVTDAQLGSGRVTPSKAAALNLAKIQGVDNQQAIGSAWGVPNVGCWRIVGVEIQPQPGNPSATNVNGLVRFGDNNISDGTKQAHNLILDRVYVHGNPVPRDYRLAMTPGQIRRCLSLNNRSSAVIDSWFEFCRGGDGDTQSILGYAGTGPYLIRNNHISGGTEVIMFGGATSGIVGAIPSDITMHGNYITRPLADTITLVKNLFEIKNAMYLDFAGNVLDNNWPNGQVGYGILIKSVNQSSGSCTWCTARDITVRYNRLTRSANGINLAGIMEGPAQPSQRFTLYHNYIGELGFRTTKDNARPIQMLSGGGTLSDVVLAYNTVDGAMYDGSGPVWGLASVIGTFPRVALQSNVMFCGGYGIKGDGLGQGLPTITASFAPYLWSNNQLYSCSSNYPTSTTYHSSLSAALASGLGANFGNLLDGVVVPR